MVEDANDEESSSQRLSDCVVQLLDSFSFLTKMSGLLDGNGENVFARYLDPSLIFMSIDIMCHRVFFAILEPIFNPPYIDHCMP